MRRSRKGVNLKYIPDDDELANAKGIGNDLGNQIGKEK